LKFKLRGLYIKENRGFLITDFSFSLWRWFRYTPC